MDLSVSYLGLKLKSPVVVGSSGLTTRIQNLKKIEKSGAGAVVIRSLFEEEIMNEYESIVREGKESDGFLDYYDYKIRDKNLTDYLDYLKAAKAAIDIPVIASINCTSAHEWTFFAKKLEQAGADAIELNMFIMPSDFDKNCTEIEQTYLEIIKKVQEQTQMPIAVKMSYYFADLAAFVRKVADSGVQGVVLFNRFFHPDFDIENFKIIPSNVLSRSTDLAISLRWVSILSGRVNTDLIASTGVHDGDSIVKEILAGATAVQVVSALYKNDIEFLVEMLDDLKSWMTRHGFHALKDFRGKMSQLASPDPAKYERAQFMKYFESKKYDYE